MPHQLHRFLRFDFGELLPVEKRADGSIVFDGIATAPGVYTYYEDGKEVRELKPPDEFGTEQALSDLAYLPITDGHPDPTLHEDGVTGANWPQLAVGMTGPDVARLPGNSLIRVQGAIRGDAGLRSVKSGSHALSCGTFVEIDKTPGTYKGERYDQVQRNPRHNHIAIVPAGRVPVAGMRYDAAELGLPAGAASMVGLLKSRTDSPGSSPDNQRRSSKVKLKLDEHLEFDVDGDVGNAVAARLKADAATINALTAERDTLTTRADEADTKAADEKKRADGAEAERDTLKQTVATSEANRADDAQKWVQDHAEAKAVANHFSIDVDGKSNAQIRRDCVAAYMPDDDTWKDAAKRDDAAVDASFPLVRKAIGVSLDSLQSLAQPREDGVGKPNGGGTYEQRMDAARDSNWKNFTGADTGTK